MVPIGEKVPWQVNSFEKPKLYLVRHYINIIYSIFPFIFQPALYNLVVVLF